VTVPFDRVLIANRGEIAVRIAATLRRLDIASVVVRAPQEPTASPHVRAGDRAVTLRADGERSPYLDVDQLVAIARAEGCDAVHPGYGFLAERADAAAAFEAAGIRWIGPSAEAIELLGDKIASKRTAVDAEVPVIPGMELPPAGSGDGTDAGLPAIEAFAAEAGLPLLLKASAGGGGKGMRRVDAADQLAAGVGAARREALAAFGRDDLLVERLVEPARHVEVQVAADHHGHVVALGERECSLQRRHQKLIEESPAPGISDALRTELHAAAVRLASAAGYRNLGTVELLVEGEAGGTKSDEAPAWFFLEMNARLQVEHPVTELVHGLDLVELQLRIAAGDCLDDLLPDGVPAPRGHAIEARICAERIAGGRFLPATGPVVGYREPEGPGVRVDSGIAVGSAVTTDFDPMLAKVIAHGRDREQARRRLVAALDGLTVLGVETNAAFLGRLLERDEVREARQTTTLLEALLEREGQADAPEGAAGHGDAADRGSGDAAASGDGSPAAPALRAPSPQARRRAAVALAAVEHLQQRRAAGDGAFDRPDGWRIGGPAATRLARLDPDDASLVLHVRPLAAGHDGERLAVAVGEDGEASDVAVLDASDDHGAAVALTDAQGTTIWRTATVGPFRWLHGPGGTWSWRPEPEATGTATVGSGSLEAPLPGVVIAVRAQPGDRVAAGTPVVVLESMKMELDVVAPHDGVVGEVAVAVGESVQRGQVLAAVEQEEDAA